MTILLLLFTAVKAAAIIYFVRRIMKILSSKDSEAKIKALIQFFLMCVVLIVINVLEFGITYLIQGDV